MDEEFCHPRLAAVYDALDPDRSDLLPYLDAAAEFGARRVADLGCGTGVLALLLAGRGCDVVGVDPAAASLAVARGKPGADRVRWIDGDASSLSEADIGAFDLATMTANVAMFLAGDAQWATALHALATALRPGGHLVFESRVPAAHAWERWTREQTWHTADVPGEGRVEAWVETLVSGISWPRVGIRNSFAFADGTLLTSESTLRFRERDELADDLNDAHLDLVDVRDVPDRPGREWLFVARRR
jgi:SAM-dependent methyltransferase